jgi:anaerobic ribonucleoside-triphosphate reductase activating protein
MNVSGIDFESVADGDGVRVVVFASGCNHHCKGCHNPASWPFDAGQPFTNELQEEIISYIQNTPYVSGVTLSGGDPMHSAGELVIFANKLKRAVPHSNIWIYSGFTVEEIAANSEMLELLRLCDVLVDGPFVLEQRDATLSYRGSRNQRVVDIAEFLGEE